MVVKAKKQLVECGAVGRNQCAHRFTYLPLLKALSDLGPLNDGMPLVILVDDRGTGYGVALALALLDVEGFKA